MAEVILVRCTSYNRQEVEAAVQRVFALAGGLARYIRPGMKVLVKPNLLVAEPPEKGITTHPEVVRAVLKELLRAGAMPVVGDSPGFGSLHRVAEKTGIARVCRELGVSLAGFTEVIEVENAVCSGAVKRFPLAADLAGVDAVINLPRMKTHGLTRVSGAVKNLYGLIAGLHKAEFHFRLQRMETFLELLVDLALTVKPVFNLMDAVNAMEGAGPRHGRLRPVNLLMGGADPFALDAAAVRVMGLEPQAIPLLALAARRGLPAVAPGEPLPVGGRLEDFIKDDYEVPPVPTPQAVRNVPDWAIRFVRQHLTLRPVVGEGCRGCKICLSSCPAGSIREEEGRIVIDPQTCIRCYCCREFCPHDAVELKIPLLRRLGGVRPGTTGNRVSATADRK